MSGGMYLIKVKVEDLKIYDKIMIGHDIYAVFEVIIKGGYADLKLVNPDVIVNYCNLKADMTGELIA